MGNTEGKQAGNHVLRTSRTYSVVGTKSPDKETGQSNDPSPDTNLHKEKTGHQDVLSSDMLQVKVGTAKKKWKNELIESRIPEQHFRKKLRQCLLNLPFGDGQEMEEKEETLARVVSQLVVKEIESGVDVISKGDSSKGIFLIMHGSVDVISANGEEVLANLHEGDFFGEISVIFNTTCTATVQTATDCTLAHLNLNDARRLLRKFDTDVIEWFATQRYLPTMKGIDVSRTTRRTALKCLQEVPVFEEWSELALKSLILQIEPALIVLYPAKSLIMLERDPPNILYVLIRGRATKMNGGGVVEINVTREPFTIGEEGIFLGSKSQVSIYAKTCCEIIQIKEGWIHNVIEQYPREVGQVWKTKLIKWKTFSGAKAILNQKYPRLLQFEVVYQFLRMSHLFGNCSGHFIQHISLQGIPLEVVVGDPLSDQSEYEIDSVVLLLKGELELVLESDNPSTITFVEGEVFLLHPDDRTPGLISGLPGSVNDYFSLCERLEQRTLPIAKTDCLVFTINNAVIKEALTLYSGSTLTLSDGHT